MAANKSSMKSILQKSFSLPLLLASVALSLGVSGSRPICAYNPFEEYDMVMYERPAFPNVDSVEVFSPGLKPLWLKALKRKEDVELQRMVIDTIAIAHLKGMQGLDEARPELVSILEDPDSRLDVVRSAASALIAFDSKDKAELLAKIAMQRKASVAQLIEPALASWKSSVMEEEWNSRIIDLDASHSMLLLAMEGLASLGSKKAIEPLTAIVKNSRANSSLRMAAARALGAIQLSGLVEVARSLADESSMPEAFGALLAIELLGGHTDEAATGLLEELLSRPSTAVQANAAGRLFEIDFNLVDRHVDELILSSDVNVRRTCVQTMIAKRDVMRVSLLAKSLDDVNPKLRRDVAAGLISLAEESDLRDQVIESVTGVLNENGWRGCEQATVVLTKLDHKPAGRRMVELLGHERAEVKVASAWGLSRLRLKELLPDMLEYAQSVDTSALADPNNGLSDQVSHLFIAFGDQQYREADSVLQTYIPKSFALGLDSRPAALWALGLIFEGELNEGLAKKMVERLNDVESLEPEDEVVRRMCAIGLARMDASSALSDLRKYSDSMQACAWAIEKMTGEKAPPQPPPGQIEVDGWFLSPIPAG